MFGLRETEIWIFWAIALVFSYPLLKRIKDWPWW